MESLDLTVAEFFAGIGLMGWGLEQDGWRVEFSHDIDPRKRRMYAGQFDAGHYVLGDIHELDATAVPTVTLATACFPCRDLSTAGNRAGLQGPESSAFWGFIDVIREMGERRPPLILIENVLGFLTTRDGRDLEDALLALNGLGYGIDMFVVNASHFVPQNRERLFIVGTRAELQPIAHAAAMPPSITPGRPRRVIRFIANHPAIDWRIRELPPFPERSLPLADLIERLPDDDSRWWPEPKAADVLARVRERHLPALEGLMARAEWSWLPAFWRTHDDMKCCTPRMDGLAGCLLAAGGFARQFLLQLGHGRLMVRWITPREAARLMGAGDFDIAVSDVQALKGFGDAVCVPAIRWMSRWYLRPLLAVAAARAGSDGVLQPGAAPHPGWADGTVCPAKVTPTCSPYPASRPTDGTAYKSPRREPTNPQCGEYRTAEEQRTASGPSPGLPLQRELFVMNSAKATAASAVPAARGTVDQIRFPLAQVPRQRETYQIICGDAGEVVPTLPQVHAVVTSPPYWGKRIYGESADEIGREQEVDDYIVDLVGIFTSIPLHPRGSIWVNIGDKCGRGGGLLGISHRFVSAMTGAGFLLADEVIWAKGIVGPDGRTQGGFLTEPARRRLNGNAFEPMYRFVRTRRASDAWTDVQAVAIPRQNVPDVRYLPEGLMTCHTSVEGRCLPNVWLIPMGQTRAKHFAVYPAALVERCIALGCPLWVNRDGSLVERQVAMVPYIEGRGSKRCMGKSSMVAANDAGEMRERCGRNDTGHDYVSRKPVTLGWTECEPEGQPGTVLDPFCGTGTTGVAALKLGRSFIGIDLYNEYCDIARGRCEETVRFLNEQGLDPLALMR